jgi:hypothetical protein
MGNINNYATDTALVGTEKLLMSDTPAGGSTKNTTVDAVAVYTFGAGAPKVTQAQRLAIVSPVLGQLVYQTDSTEGTYQYKSTGWVAL